ncbi:hypothetical protein ZWY2020_025645 [Hordeum vulgare]|nr:hypothetical protein ZWY2020_025645 [Hordeum vulgare]
MVFSTEGAVPYKEGLSIGVVTDGEDKNGKPHKLRLYSIAGSALGDFGDAKTNFIMECVAGGGHTSEVSPSRDVIAATILDPIPDVASLQDLGVTLCKTNEVDGGIYS